MGAAATPPSPAILARMRLMRARDSTENDFVAFIRHRYALGENESFEDVQDLGLIAIEITEAVRRWSDRLSRMHCAALPVAPARAAAAIVETVFDAVLPPLATRALAALVAVEVAS